MHVSILSSMLLIVSLFCQVSVGEDPRLRDAEFTNFVVNRDSDGKVIDVQAGFKYQDETYTLFPVEEPQLSQLAERIDAGQAIIGIASSPGTLDAHGERLVSAVDADLLRSNLELVKAKFGRLVRDHETGMLTEDELPKQVKAVDRLLSDVKGLLSRDQIEFINELRLRGSISSRGVAGGIVEYPYAELLRISPEQKDAIRASKQELEEEFMKEFDALMKKHEAKILDQLTDEQKKEWTKLMGDRPTYNDAQQRTLLRQMLRL